MSKQHEKLARRLREIAKVIEQSSQPGHRLNEMTRLVERLHRLLHQDARKQQETVTGSFDPNPESPITIWCDGSCSPNPGPGGWGAIIEQDGKRMELSGAHPDCTNNIMEMTAAMEALKRTPQGARIRVVTDSQYVVNGITRWLAGWKRKDWRKSDGEPVLNLALWQELDELNARRTVAWEWVRGHQGHPENERSDQLANQARETL